MTKFVSVPREMGHLNPAAFVAGIVRGALDGAGFPARCGGLGGVRCASSINVVGCSEQAFPARCTRGKVAGQTVHCLRAAWHAAGVQHGKGHRPSRQALLQPLQPPTSPWCCSLRHRRVTAHYVPVQGQPRPKTVILMKFQVG